ncbi:MAG: oxidoreductase-like domain-containing protein [Pseudomonadota bacterium]
MTVPANPPPIPPEKPLPGDCCDGGCAVCVWEAYDDALRHYHEALAAWQANADASASPCAGTDAGTPG